MLFGKKTVITPETAHESYEFTYQLSYDEVFEAFWSLSQKWNRKITMIITAVITAITVFLLGMYLLDSTRVNYFFVAAMAIFVLFYVIYMPYYKAKKGALKVSKQGGYYKIRISRQGQILLPRLEPLELAGDKDARAIETRNLIVVRTDSTHTFCIPKRVMKEYEIEDVRKICQAYMKFRDRTGDGKKNV